MRKPYKVNVTRDGKFWMLFIPALHGVTQARHFHEIETMARDFIAVSTDRPVSTVFVRVEQRP